MQKRVGRIVILVLLLGTTVAGAFLVRFTRHITQLTAAQQDLNSRLFKIGNTVAAIGQSEQSYIAPGQDGGPWFDRTATLAAQLSEDLKDLRAHIRSSDAMSALDALVLSCDALIEADNRIRQNLRLGQTLMAADVLFSDSRNILDATATRIGDVREAEEANVRAESGGQLRKIWATGGAVGLGWITIALLSFFRPARDTQQLATVDTAPAQVATPPATAIDLAKVAELCTDLARVATTAALPSLLRRAAELVNASGVILWMSAGEQLFAVTGHGYDPQLLPRLGAVPRDADNAAALAWRTGRIIVQGVEDPGPGALVAPLFGPHGCFGVLAFELRPEARPDASIEPIAGLLAAQLAAAVAAWPAASQAHPVLDLTLDEPEAIRRRA